MPLDDENALSEALGTLYECILDPAQWTSALERLSRYVGGSSALVFYQDRRSRSGDFLQSYNADPDWTRLYFEKYVSLNPVMPLTAYMDVGSSTCFSRVVDTEEFKASRFYIEWAAPQDFLDVVVTVLAKSATTMGMFGVTRLAHEGVAGEVEIRRMEIVSPHVRRAVTVARQFDGLRQFGAALSGTFDALSDAVWLLDPSGRILFANAASRALVAADGPVMPTGERLAFRDRKTNERLREALARTESSIDPRAGIELAVVARNGRRFIANLVPLTIGSRRSPLPTAATAALFVREVVTDQVPPLQALAQLYDLTPREFQVFSGILQFGSVPEVARIFGISPTTVRTHLQQVFDKTGVRTQAGLMQLAASAMPPVSPQQ